MEIHSQKSKKYKCQIELQMQIDDDDDDDDDDLYIFCCKKVGTFRSNLRNSFKLFFEFLFCMIFNVIWLQRTEERMRKSFEHFSGIS